MNLGITLWNELPLKCSIFPDLPTPFSPVQRQRKFSAVRGTTSDRSSISIRPLGCPPMATSKKTTGFPADMVCVLVDVFFSCCGWKRGGGKKGGKKEKKEGRKIPSGKRVALCKFCMEKFLFYGQTLLFLLRYYHYSHLCLCVRRKLKKNDYPIAIAPSNRKYLWFSVSFSFGADFNF